MEVQQIQDCNESDKQDQLVCSMFIVKLKAVNAVCNLCNHIIFKIPKKIVLK